MAEYDADFYKTTVFLPTTEFPMRGGLPQKEPGILARWQEMDLYKKLREQAAESPDYILHDGPPYANGHIHIGHAQNKVLKDIVTRSTQMVGYDSNYVPGWDCHGLPIEWKIEEQVRESGGKKEDIPVLEFRARCRDFARHWVDVQSEEFQRLGVIGDWKNPYLTMSNAGEAGIVREIHKFLLNGSLYIGLKPVMWSVVEQTALAEAEIEYKEHKSVTVWVRFPVVSTETEALKGTDIVIWTTTPWTLPSNRGIAAGENIEYGVYQLPEGDKVVLATSLAEATFEKAGIEGAQCLTTLGGDAIRNTVCAHPLRDQGYDFDVPVLHGDFVTDDAGTGFVHIAPGHGQDDYFLGVEKGLEVTDNVSDDGLFRDHVPLFAGMEVYTQKGEMGGGNFAVIKAINEAGKLMAKGSLRHEYPHSWRSKAPIIFRTTAQWFIAMDDQNEIRSKALDAIAETRWIPERGETRIRAMIEQRPDWCISRQRSWGVPIALFIDKKTGEPLKDKQVLERIGNIFEAEGSDSWWSRPAQEFLGDDYKAEDYEQVFDIVDVWFESGSTHAFVLEQRDDLYSPADMYLEGSDQHRGWFHSSLLESCGTRGRAPYKSVLTHGFTLDEKGYKMSKSLGNTVAPQDIIDEYGADILRLWVVTADYAQDVRIGKDILKATSDTYRRIRNSLRFLLGALEGFSEAEAVDLQAEYDNLPELERLALHRLKEMDSAIGEDVANADFGAMADRLYHFCAQELSSFYFDIRKDRLYCDRPDLFERRACRTVLCRIFESLVVWLSPILSFTSEEAWSHYALRDSESVHLKTMSDLPEQWQNQALADQWSGIRKVRSVVLGAIEIERNNKTLGSSLEAHPLITVADAELAALLDRLNMADICITSQCTIQVGAVGADLFTLDHVPGVGVSIQKAAGNKCERCWKILPEVGTDSEFPNLTLRDADAVRWYLEQRKAA